MDIMEMGASDELVSKWGPALDGINSDYTKRVTAQLLENQLKATEAVNEDAVGVGTTTVGQLGTFQKFAFPLVRRVFPELIANNLVSVQPMSGPVSQVFYLGSSRTADGARQTLYSKYQLTYAGGRTGEFTDASGIDLDTVTIPDDTSGMAAHALSSVLGGKAEGLDATSNNYNALIAKFPSATNGHGWSVSAGELLAGSAIPEVSLQIQQSPVVARTKKMRALWTLEASQDLKAYHNLDLERELTDLLGKEIRLEVDRELIEDLRGIAYDISGAAGMFDYAMLDQHDKQTNVMDFNGVNGDSDFGQFQFLGTDGSDLGLPGVTTAVGGNKNIWLVDLTSSAFNFAPRHVGDIYSNLLAVINFASQDIYTTTQRGAGNWIICAPAVATLLESAARLQGGIEKADGPTNFGPGTIQFRGKFMGRYDLFVDPLYPEGEILMGYKGGSTMDGGFIYAPYIPFQALPTLTDPESFQPRKGILTRYGKVAIAPTSRFYRVIRIVGPGGLYAPFKNVAGK